MKKTYINGIGSISAQKTHDTVFLEDYVLSEEENVLRINVPIYKNFIAPAAIRRMSKGVKNGTVAAALAMNEADVHELDAIITGTGMGCIEDSDKFLKALIDNNEEFLTPTSFIQSTHNTVGSQIAMGLQCKAYNFTYVNAAVSFESALMDAKMLLEEEEGGTILIGGVDEMSDYTASLFKLAGFIKSEEEKPYSVLNSKSTGAVYSEGATFFVIENQVKETTYAEVLDIDIINSIEIEEVETHVVKFLKANKLNISDIDVIILGLNGDIVFDAFYKTLSEKTFSNTQQVYYKHLSGEYNTASAFGLCVGAKIIKFQHIPEVIKVNSLKKKKYKNVLLYNQYRGIDHSFTLISDVKS